MYAVNNSNFRLLYTKLLTYCNFPPHSLVHNTVSCVIKKKNKKEQRIKCILAEKGDCCVWKLCIVQAPGSCVCVRAAPQSLNE